jgi:antitoxin (DNA-binding transcriptional repressor) of toxin-antitoxin stability system
MRWQRPDENSIGIREARARLPKLAVAQEPTTILVHGYPTAVILPLNAPRFTSKRQERAHFRSLLAQLRAQLIQHAEY